MEFGFMKRVDYWAGRPLCWLLTLWRRIIPGRPAGATPPERILIIKPSELGAIILAFPLINRLQQQYPQARISFLTFAANRSLFEVSRMVPADQIITLREGSFGVFLTDVISALARIRRERYDVVIDLEFFSRFTAIVSFFSGAPKRAGFHRYSIEGVYRGDLFTHRVPYNPHRHVQQMYLHMISSLDKSFKDTPENDAPDPDYGTDWRYQPSDDTRDRIRTKLAAEGVDPAARLYLLAPGEGRIPLREWPLENFVSLADRILEDPQARVVVVGLQDPAGRAGHLLNTVRSRDRVTDWVGRTDLPELLTLFSLAKGVVAADSGLAHLAALTPVKNYVLFGPEHPRIFQPLGENTVVFYLGLPCSPCLSVFNHRNSACRDNLCLKHISVDEVYRSLVDN